MLAAEPHLILPCESRFREFDAKLLLACHAAERGWRAIVGAMKEIDQQAARLPRGIYISKGVTRKKLFMLRLLPRLGHVVTAWDEEGLVYASPEVYRATKVDARALNAPVRLFAWGEANATGWRGHPGYAGGPISVTGNPRTDLLRPELRGYFAEEARRLRQRHGEFILVNTNFSLLNNFIPSESLHRRLLEDGGGRMVSQDDPRLGLAAHKTALFRRFVEMVPAVARRFPAHKLVLRPHPSESAATWRQVLAECPNAEVVYEGNVAAWLMAATALVHNGCTTAVESFLLDRPAIAYRPIVSEQYDHPLPNALSVPAFNLDELFERLAETLGGSAVVREEVLAPRRVLARAHIGSYEGATASERILDSLDEVLATHGNIRPRLLDRTAGWAAAEGRRLFKRARTLIPNHRDNPVYLRHMFPPVVETEVATSIRRFGALLGRFQGLRLQELTKNIFVVTRR